MITWDHDRDGRLTPDEEEALAEPSVLERFALRVSAGMSPEAAAAEVLAYVERLEAVADAARRVRAECGPFCDDCEAEPAHAAKCDRGALDRALAALDAGGESRG